MIAEYEKILNRLLLLETKKTRAIQDRKLKELEELTRSSEDLSLQLDKLEEARLNDPQSAAWVSEKESKQKAKIGEIFSKLRTRVKTNQKLIQANLGVIQDTMRNLGAVEQEPGYQDKGPTPPTPRPAGQSLVLNMES